MTEMYVICRVAMSDELLQQLEASLMYHLQPLERELAERLNGRWAFRISQGHLELGCDRRQRLEEEHLQGMQEVIAQRVALLASERQEQRVHLMLEAAMIQHVREVQNLLTRNLGVEIGILPEDGQLARLDVVGVPRAVENAQMELQQHRQEGFARAQRQLAEEARQSVSIFVDNLNISMGCQVLSTGRDSSQRLRMPAFSEVVAGARTVASRMVVDHWTRGNHRVCWLWQLCGFWVERSASMADCILAHIRSLRGHDRNQVLALCTGDGRHVDIVRYLVRRGWTIEIWCWRESCHSDYLALDESHRNLRICYLDGFRPQVTMARTREFPHLPDRQETQAVVLGAREADQDHHQGYRYQGVLVREDDAVPEPPQQPQVEDVDLCTFCYSEEATFAFRPCNHRVLCANCAQDVMQRFHRNQELRLSANMNRCFLCRAPWIRLNRDR